MYTEAQKQSFGGVLRKRCSSKFRKIQRKIPAPESEKETLIQVFPVNFAKFLRTPPVAAFVYSRINNG